MSLRPESTSRPITDAVRRVLGNVSSSSRPSSIVNAPDGGKDDDVTPAVSVVLADAPTTEEVFIWAPSVSLVGNNGDCGLSNGDGDGDECDNGWDCSSFGKMQAQTRSSVTITTLATCSKATLRACRSTVGAHTMA